MIPIGKFSRICQVSVKTLRLYDQIGILKQLISMRIVRIDIMNQTSWIR